MGLPVAQGKWPTVTRRDPRVAPGADFCSRSKAVRSGLGSSLLYQGELGSYSHWFWQRWSITWGEAHRLLLVAIGVPWISWGQDLASNPLYHFKQDVVSSSCHWRRKPKLSLVLINIALWPPGNLTWYDNMLLVLGTIAGLHMWVSSSVTQHKCQATPVMVLLWNDFVCYDTELWKTTQLSLIQDKRCDHSDHM